MKLLVTGDWHHRSLQPVARLDDIGVVLATKITEVGEIARREDCAAIIEPGDITNSPGLAYSTLAVLENLIRGLDKSVWSIPGNHDEHAHSLESIERTAYGHLVTTGLVRDLARQPVETDTITVTGAGFSASTDNDVSDYLAKPAPNATKGSVRIHVAHGMLLERAPGFDLKHTLLEEVAKHPDCPDVLICGHEHLGFGVRRLPRAGGGELVAINPGALVRLSAHPGEIERTPQVCVLEVYPGAAPFCHHCDADLPADKAAAHIGDDRAYVVTCPKCGYRTVVELGDYGPPEIWGLGSPVIETRLIPLATARPGHEVLSREHIEQAIEREAKMGKFLGLLANEGEAKFLDIQSMVEGIANSDNLPRVVVSETFRYLSAAREKLERGRAA